MHALLPLSAGAAREAAAAAALEQQQKILLLVGPLQHKQRSKRRSVQTPEGDRRKETGKCNSIRRYSATLHCRTAAAAAILQLLLLLLLPLLLLLLLPLLLLLLLLLQHELH